MRWLSQQEKDRLVYRLEVDRSSKDATDEVTAWAAFKLASCDPKTWLLCSVLYCNYIAASVTNFFPVVGKKISVDSSSSKVNDYWQFLAWVSTALSRSPSLALLMSFVASLS